MTTLILLFNCEAYFFIFSVSILDSSDEWDLWYQALTGRANCWILGGYESAATFKVNKRPDTIRVRHSRLFRLILINVIYYGRHHRPSAFISLWVKEDSVLFKF